LKSYKSIYDNNYPHGEGGHRQPDKYQNRGPGPNEDASYEPGEQRPHGGGFVSKADQDSKWKHDKYDQVMQEQEGSRVESFSSSS